MIDRFKAWLASDEGMLDPSPISPDVQRRLDRDVELRMARIVLLEANDGREPTFREIWAAVPPR